MALLLFILLVPARLDAETPLPQVVQADPGPCGDPVITVSPMSGGRSQFSITDACRAQQTVRFSYAGVLFQQVMDAGGRLDFVLDCFAGDGTPVEIAFQDGSVFTRNAVARDMKRVSKVSVLWSAEVNLDLHAFEYAAAMGKLGHVWAGAPSSPDLARQNGRADGRGQGFMSHVSEGRNGESKLEVYTFWHQRRQPRGVVRLALDYESRGSMPNGETCDGGRFAEIRFLVLMLSKGGQSTRSQGVFEAVACGVPLGEQARYSDKAIPDLFIGK